MMKAINFSSQLLRRRLMAGNQEAMAHQFKCEKIRCQSLNYGILLDLYFMPVKPVITSQFPIWLEEKYHFNSFHMCDSYLFQCHTATILASELPQIIHEAHIAALLIALWWFQSASEHTVDADVKLLFNHCYYRTDFIVSHLYLTTVKSTNCAKWIFSLKKYL